MVINPLDAIGSVTDFAKNIVDRIWPKKMNEAEKAAAILEVEKLVQAREDIVVGAQRDIMVAELQQGDNYTKRARPSIVYVGVAVILFNYVLVPFIGQITHWILELGGSPKAATFADVALIQMPEMFWYVWGGACGIYSLGRTLEKRQDPNAMLGLLNNKKETPTQAPTPPAG